MKLVNLSVQKILSIFIILSVRSTYASHQVVETDNSVQRSRGTPLKKLAASTSATDAALSQTYQSSPLSSIDPCHELHGDTIFECDFCFRTHFQIPDNTLLEGKEGLDDLLDQAHQIPDATTSDSYASGLKRVDAIEEDTFTDEEFIRVWVKRKRCKKELTTALMHVCRGNSIESAEELIEAGADVNGENELGTCRLLHLAVCSNNSELVRLLLEYGAPVDAKNKWGNTPLHLAAVKGSLEIAKLLLLWGAALNAQNDKKQTPLHYAVLYDHPHFFAHLIDIGAKDDSLDFQGKSPLHYVEQRVKAL